MGNRRQYSSNFGNSAAIEHVRAFEEYSRKLGPIVTDVQSAFFDLKEDQLKDLLIRYGADHGVKAQNYAQETYPLWKHGVRKMSGQTMERLLNLVPKYLSTDERYKITKRLCLHHTEKQLVNIRINKEEISEGIKKIDAVLDSFIVSQSIKHLPSHVTDTATWLNDDDVTVSRTLLSRIDHEESLLVKAIVNKNRENLIRILNDKAVNSLTETIEFPTGTITITLYKDSFCVVASYLYESTSHADVLSLRKFRDRHLVSFALGQRFVHWYYLNGTAMVEFLKSHKMISKVIKALLGVCVRIIERSERRG